MRRSILAALLLVGLTGCASVRAVPGGAVVSQSLGRDDRLVVRAHDDVIGVAVSARHVFALSTGGLATFDRVFDRWIEPSAEVADALQLAGTSRARFAVMAADPIEEAVWIGVPGGVVIYRPRVEQVVRVPVIGEPELIAFARGGVGDAFVRSGGQWSRVSRAGFASPLPSGPGNVALQPPSSLEDVYARHPALRAQLPFLLRDAEGATMTARIATAAIAPDRPSEVWVGTIGDGLWQVDAGLQQVRAMTYGVRDADIGALAIAADGVWSAGQGSARAFSLSFVRPDLQQFARRAHRGFANTSGMRVQQLVVRERNAWLATDRGLWRVPLVGRDAPLSQWRVSSGLPDDVVLAVVPRFEGAWVGTRRGLAFVPDAESGREVTVQPLGFAGEAVRALAAVGDQLYVGTPGGLFVRDARAEGSAVERVPGVLPRPVTALAWHDSVLLVVSERAAELCLLTDAGPGQRLRADSLARLELALADIGVPLRAHVDARSLWIAGTAGVLVWRRDRLLDAPRLLRAGAELPAAITDLVVDDTWAWVGTREGVVRVRLAAEGGLP